MALTDSLPVSNSVWPVGDGEIARLIRTHDWSHSALGPTHLWPELLRMQIDTILQSPVPLVVLWGPQAVLLYNDAYMTICGPRHPGTFCKPVAIAWPESAEFNMSVVAKGFKGQSSSFERQPFTLYRGEQAEILWFNLIYSPLVDRDGQPQGMVVIVIDITGQIIAEQQREANSIELSAVEERLRLTFGASELVGTWDWDMAEDKVIADPRFANLYGVDASLASTGVPIAEFTRNVHPDDQPILHQAIERMMIHGGEFSQEYRLLQNNGSCRWVVARGRLRYDGQGKPTSFPGVAVDITERKQIELVMEGQKRALEAAVADAPLQAVLDILARTVEMQSDTSLHCVIMVASRDEQTLQKGAAPTMPPECYDSIDGIPVAPGNAACGTAAYNRQDFIAADITADPLCADFRDTALAYNIRACWSVPLISSQNRLLGVFSLYYHQIHKPTRHEREIVELMARTAALVIERQQDTALRKLVENRLRQSEQRLRLLSEMDEATRNIQNPGEVMDILTSLVGTYFNASRCAYADVDGDQNRFNIRNDYVNDGLSSTVGEYHLDLFGQRTAKKMREGKTLVIGDVSAELGDGADADMFRAIGVAAIICCPLIKQNKLLGIMVLHSATPREWTEKEIKLFEAATERSWSSIERARADMRLRESEEGFRQLANATPQVVWRADAVGRIDYVNDRSEDYSGPIPLVDGRYDWAGFIAPEDIERSDALWAQSVATGDPLQIEQRIFHKKSGMFRWNLSLALPVHDETGNVVRWYGTNTDIDDQKKFAAELAAARDAAEAANIAKSEFLANMSHEIRTPMNAVIGLSHILIQSQPLTDKQKHYLSTLQMSADGLLVLINDMLDIAKIESRSIELEEIAFNLSSVMQEVISMLAMRAREKGLEFHFDGECVTDRVFVGDPARIRQIILNLCGNAVKFTDNGSVSIKVTCGGSVSHMCRQDVTISVKDTGIGIAPSRTRDIFEKFVQADTSINRKYGGTGLGLAITKTLVEFMGGTISVESRPDHGSTFTVVIPLLTQPSDEDAPMLEKPVAQPQAVAGTTILLVEDYAPNVMVAGAYLEQFGYAYDVATSGLEAIERVKATRYAAILMDVQMHDMNGFDATMYIRDMEDKGGHKRMPIIGMTAHAMVGDRERCLAAGMDDYLAKPFNPVMLKALLDRLVEKNP